MAVHNTGRFDTGRKALRTLWGLALIYAAVNSIALSRRAPIMSRQTVTADERSAREAAGWLRAQPRNVRLLLLLSDQDLIAPWFRYRLNYFIYPIRMDVATNSLPADAEKRYDLVLTYGVTRAWLSPQWKHIAASERAMLAATGFSGAVSRSSPPYAPPDIPQRAGKWLRLPLGFFSIAVVFVLGALVGSRTLRGPPFAFWWANLAVAHLIGATILAWLIPLTAMTTGRMRALPVYLLLALFAPGWRRVIEWRQPRVDARDLKPDEVEDAHSARWWKRGALVLILMGGCSVALWAWYMGVGWDGYAIWQFKAKAFYLDGQLDFLRETQRYEYAHLDYPLMVPVLSWWTYAHIGAVSDRWAQAQNFLFYLDLLALFAVFSIRYVPLHATLAGMALLVTLSNVATHAVSGFADVPMAAFLLGIGGSLALLVAGGSSTHAVLLAWLLAGATLVKNEGLLACVNGLATIGVCLWWKRRERNHPDAKWLLLIGGALVAYLPWFVLKRAWGLTNDLLEPTKPVHFTATLVAWRLGHTLRAIVAQLAHLGPWAPNWGLFIALIPTGLYLSVRRHIMSCGPLWLFGGFQLAGYVGIYLITPQALLGHVASSMDRLLTHVAPLLLLAALIGCFAGADRTLGTER